MYDLKKFLEAQAKDYETALKEIRRGHKTSHWIWYIFPQLRALGRSSTAQYYGIENLDEAKEYLADKVLRERLLEISGALLELDSSNIEYIMGSSIDKKKLKSSMTLFHLAEPTCEVFSRVLGKYFGGELDEVTVQLCR